MAFSFKTVGRFSLSIDLTLVDSDSLEYDLITCFINTDDFDLFIILLSTVDIYIIYYNKLTA